MERCEHRITYIPQIFSINQYDRWTPKYDFLHDNNTFPVSSISGIRDINKYTILFSDYINFIVNEVYSPYIKEVPAGTYSS